jgi:glycosyltransferase involved in cell wall biosynthesis
MKIAIQAADLDADRIDGTRVYILNVLRYLGKIDPESRFLIYHKGEFNPELTPPIFPNYEVIQKKSPCAWTQTRLAYELWKERPEVLWMPMHNIPLVRRSGLKTVVTIHDLAFKYFPECFPRRDLFNINLLTKLAVERSDKIITISESSKRDILKFYPKVSAEKIKVIYHGFDAEVFLREREFVAENEVKNKYGISGGYILYTGGIQPRKNLLVLLEAFESIKGKFPNLKLVFVGEKAWLSDHFFEKIEKSPHKKDIILTGKASFSEVGHLYRGARIYVYPSLYDGFGITPLEAFASRVPVICANNSSLPEVCGDAALYFNEKKPAELAERMKELLNNEELRVEMISRGLSRLKKFSWERCARETLEFLKPS